MMRVVAVRVVAVRAVAVRGVAVIPVGGPFIPAAAAAATILLLEGDSEGRLLGGGPLEDAGVQQGVVSSLHDVILRVGL